MIKDLGKNAGLIFDREHLDMNAQLWSRFSDFLLNNLDYPESIIFIVQPTEDFSEEDMLIYVLEGETMRIVTFIDES